MKDRWEATWRVLTKGMEYFWVCPLNSGVHTKTLNFEVMLATTVPKGIKLEVFVRVDNVAVIKLEEKL